MNWKNFFGLAIGIIALRVVGFIPSIWLAAGFVVIVWFWSYLLDQFPGKKRLINWSLSILLIASITGTIGWNLYVSYIQPYSGMSGAAWERAKFAADLKMSLKLNPDMLKSRRELAGQLQALQDAIGDQQEGKLFDIRRRLQAGFLTPQQAWEETEKFIKEESEYREKTEKAVSQILGQELPAPTSIPAAALVPKPKIVWILDQTVEVSPDKWTDLPLKFDGKEHKFVPDIKSGEIEFLADGRYGTAKAFEQFDFGEIRKSLKARSIKGDAVVYMYTANPL